MYYNFEWDNRKAKTNQTKHGVSFQQAATVFLDPRMLVLYDREHSDYEERWITVGNDHRGLVLTVCHTYTQEAEQTALIRIFSARKATAHETQHYQEI
jgi:uncharacterized protein